MQTFAPAPYTAHSISPYVKNITNLYVELLTPEESLIFTLEFCIFNKKMPVFKLKMFISNLEMSFFPRFR